ncbi:AraC family transcriptional regulator ligand-binding domain-containing protein [Pseudoduganella sp. RAF19]|uniref:AraC family transcriptional regulator n=1 Tax=Pseudoduganella sp. RAF19 TaxID=3233052 RepID=UPI003F9710B2
MIRFSTSADACIPALPQPALLLEFARSQELPETALMRGSRLLPQALDTAGGRITPAQYLQLLENLLKLAGSPDTSFLLGQQMLPGQAGAISHALLHAPDLRHALDLLCAGHARLTPLLCPRWREADGMAVLYWSDSFGAHSLRPALVEMHMAALVSLCRWLSGARLPWRFCFNRAAPRHVEQHEVHLGSALRFNCHLDAMLVDASCLDQPWPRGSNVVSALALRQAEAELQAAPGLLAALYDYLLEHVRCAPSLEQASATFGFSAATMKRHLQRHGTHFQAELDQVRSHVALYLFLAQRADNEAVAHYLGFHDAANFRRSFKRWTGLTPGLLREGLAIQA